MRILGITIPDNKRLEIGMTYLYGIGRSRAKDILAKAGVDFARLEGIIPAPESTHAIKAAIDEALKCKESSESKTILFNLSGHGFLDLKGYEDYLGGKL